MSNFLEGKKTYIGLLVTVIGMTGLSAYVAPEESEALFKALFEIVGICVAIYGRFVARTEG